MKTRLITSVVGLALLAVVMMFFHTLVFETVVAILAVIGLHEIYMAMKPEQGGLAIFGGMAVYTAVMMFSGLPAVGFITQPLTVLLLVFVACCVIRNSRTLDFKKVAGMLAFGAMLLLCFYSLVELKYLLPVEKYGSDALYIIFLILGFAWGGDSAAYLTGRAFGKHKLAPVVSPNKTVEGAVGAVVGSVALGAIITAIYGVISQGQVIHGLTLQHYLTICLLGAVASVLGMLGDLFASAVKRQCGIKDYGYIFPGHGGILDRFDSLLFIAPFVTVGVEIAFGL